MFFIGSRLRLLEAEECHMSLSNAWALLRIRDIDTGGCGSHEG